MSIAPGATALTRISRRALDRELAGELDDRALARRVGGLEREPDHARDRRGRDDRAAAAPAQRRDRRPAEQERAFHVHGLDAVPLLLARLHDRLPDDQAGVADEDVEAAEALLGQRHRPFGRDVPLERRHRVRLERPASTSTATTEAPRSTSCSTTAAPERPARARDDRDLAGEVLAHDLVQAVRLQHLVDQAEVLARPLAGGPVADDRAEVPPADRHVAEDPLDPLARRGRRSSRPCGRSRPASPPTRASAPRARPCSAAGPPRA